MVIFILESVFKVGIKTTKFFIRHFGLSELEPFYDLRKFDKFIEKLIP